MESVIGGAVVGVIIGVAAPSVLSGIGEAVRPLVKEVLKGGIVAYTAVSEMVSETGEQFNDIVAEARAEIAQTADAKASS